MSGAPSTSSGDGRPASSATVGYTYVHQFRHLARAFAVRSCETRGCGDEGDACSQLEAGLLRPQALLAEVKAVIAVEDNSRVLRLAQQLEMV